MKNDSNESTPIERSSCELALFALAVAGLWMTGAGIVMDNYYLGGFGAALMLLVIGLFIRREKQ